MYTGEFDSFKTIINNRLVLIMADTMRRQKVFGHFAKALHLQYLTSLHMLANRASGKSSLLVAWSSAECLQVLLSDEQVGPAWSSLLPYGVWSSCQNRDQLLTSQPAFLRTACLLKRAFVWSCWHLTQE